MSCYYFIITIIAIFLLLLLLLLYLLSVHYLLIYHNSLADKKTIQAGMPSNKYSSAIMAESDKMTATVRVCDPRPFLYKLCIKQMHIHTH